GSFPWLADRRSPLSIGAASEGWLANQSSLAFPASEGWQARRESNPQPPVLETGALPIELLAYSATGEMQNAETKMLNAAFILHVHDHFCSLRAVCFRQNRQYLLISMRSVVFFLFFDVA